MTTFICIFCSLLYIILIAYFLIGWLRLKATSAIEISGKTKVSVIVPVRNEAPYIQNCLSTLAQQVYPRDRYELILVDDYSNDETLSIARKLDIDNLRVLSLAEQYGNQHSATANKKKSIALGVSESTGNLIITIDGDCVVGDQWLNAIVSFYESSSCKMIAGPVGYVKSERFFEAFQELDFISMIGITGACIKNRFPVMCNGANLAFEKSAFLSVSGYDGVDTLPSGDDTFLMHKIHQKFPGSIGFIRQHEAVVTTIPATTLKNFINQRKRWVSKSTTFQNKIITGILSFAYLVNAALIILLFAAMINPGYFLHLFLIIFTAKMMADFIFLLPVVGFFNRSKLLFLFPAFQVAHWIYVFVIGIWGTFGSYRWKGRFVYPSYNKS